jgi:hypothetical protein
MTETLSDDDALQFVRLASELCDAIERAAPLPNGMIGRALFSAFLAVATREKGSTLTIAEVSRITADMTHREFAAGRLSR